MADRIMVTVKNRKGGKGGTRKYGRDG